MNLRHEFRRDLRRQFGYEDFIEHCGTAWSFQLQYGIYFVSIQSCAIILLHFVVIHGTMEADGAEATAANPVDSNLGCTPGVSGEVQTRHVQWTWRIRLNLRCGQNPVGVGQG